MERGGNRYYYHADGLGSITSMTDSTEAVINRYAYDSFGAIEKSESIRNAYTYTGREYDSETGLYYYRARYYDPEAGRFITNDPSLRINGDTNIPYLLLQLLEHPQELHQFSYVINNPINFADPSGFGLLSAIKCYRLTNKYDELFEKCEKECVPPSRNDLPALAEYTYGTFDLNEPIRRCVDKKDPNLVKDILKACSTATLPMPIPRRIK